MSYHVAPAPFATYASSATQSVANAANAQAITYNLNLGSKGINLIASTKIQLPQVGNYCLTFSAIGHNSGSASAKWFNIFLRKNGVIVDNSSTIVATKKDEPSTVVATFNVECSTSGDYYELMMAAQDTGGQILATAAQAAVPGVSPAMPACPSIIVAVWQID